MSNARPEIIIRDTEGNTKISTKKFGSFDGEPSTTASISQQCAKGFRDGFG
jgi:hypothetical protein